MNTAFQSKGTGKTMEHMPPAAATIRSVSDAINALSDPALMEDLKPGQSAKRGDDYFGLWFRGHSRVEHDLTPSILRESIGQRGRYVDEVSLTRHFKAMNPDAASSDSSDFEWLVTMQHYLAPTRLLDWTENLLVALYFAVRDDALDGKADAAVWLLNARRLNYYSSGTTRASELAFPDDPDVIARSVLCRVREREEWLDVFTRTLRQCRCDRADYRHKRIQEAIAAVQLTGASVNDVNCEKLDLTRFKGTKGTQGEAINLYSKDHWNNSESLYARMRMPVAVYAPRSNRRIRTQSGVFTLHGGKFVHKPTSYKKREVYRSAIGMPIGLLELDAGLKKKRILKWLRIPKNDRVSIRRTLAQIGVTDATLFPELDYQSKYLITRWTYSEPKEEEEAD